MTSLRALAPTVAMNVVLGLPAYFVALLIAYGFRDSVGAAAHVTFLLLIAAFSSGCGAVQISVRSSGPPEDQKVYILLADRVERVEG